MKICPARWYAKCISQRPKQLIVLHDMEVANKPGSAIGVGQYFARLPANNKASAHLGVDCNEAVRYVYDEDIAYGAPGANAIGLHLELAGFASYIKDQWSSDQMQKMLNLAVVIVQSWCDTYGIPKQFLTANQLARYPAGAVRPSELCGITTHAEVSKAWKLTDHTDPGGGFPVEWFISMLQPNTANISNAKTKAEVKDMPPFIQINSPTGGFWLVKRSDGGVFCYNTSGVPNGQGAPPFYGSLSSVGINAPVEGLTPYMKNGFVAGYWLWSSDGGVFCFGAAPFTDSYAGHPEWQKGNRYITGLEQHDPGYDLIFVETDSDPPKINRYDLSVKR